MLPAWTITGQEVSAVTINNIQALALGIVSTVLATLLGWLIFPLCINLALFVYAIMLGVKAYNGEYVTIPVITDFVKGQGWS